MATDWLFKKSAQEVIKVLCRNETYPTAIQYEAVGKVSEATVYAVLKKLEENDLITKEKSYLSKVRWTQKGEGFKNSFELLVGLLK